MNPNISAEYIDKIKIAFGIDSEPVKSLASWKAQETPSYTYPPAYTI